ncbi:MAG: SIS domain-containing protein [Rhodothermales bacterium]
MCNAVGSTIARETDAGVYLHAGRNRRGVDEGVHRAGARAEHDRAQTGGGADAHAGGDGLSPRALAGLPDQVREVLKIDEEIRSLSATYRYATNFLRLGRGYNFPVALEGALKLKEISYIHAEGYPAAEMKHGPIALIDRQMPVVFIALKDGTYDKVISNIEEVVARQGSVIAITEEAITNSTSCASMSSTSRRPSRSSRRSSRRFRCSCYPTTSPSCAATSTSPETWPRA